jgi:hypothetical protein
MRALRSSSARRDAEFRRVPALLAAVLAVLIGKSAHAAEDPKERSLAPSEVEAWLDSSGQPATDTGADNDQLVPPPPPRHKGFVVESSIGALGQVGPMKHYSPVAPWFHVQFGYEPLRALMVFAEGDLVLGNTSYARPPPEPRTYALWGFGAGLRGTVKPTDRVGLYLQASVGGDEVSGDVLGTYGFSNATSFNLYLAAELGIEWYQVSRHLALAVHGGLRDYTSTFEQDLNSQAPLAWVSGVALRYTF